MFSKMRHSSTASVAALLPKLSNSSNSDDRSDSSVQLDGDWTIKSKGEGTVNPCYSDEASVISQIYLQCVRRGPTIQMTDREEDALRRSYIEIMRRRTWKCELIAVAETLINMSATMTMRTSARKHGFGDAVSDGETTAPYSPPRSLVEDTLVTITYDDHEFTFSSSRSRAICIGRHSACDVVLRAKEPPWTCSRLHAVLYVIPARNELIVADVGSYHGIRTTWRSHSKKGRPSSYPGHRFLLTFSLEEELGLRLGSQLMYIKTRKIYVPRSTTDSAVSIDSHLDKLQGSSDFMLLDVDADHRVSMTTSKSCLENSQQNDQSLSAIPKSLQQQSSAQHDMSPKCLLRKEEDGSLKLYSLAGKQESSRSKDNDLEISRWLLSSKNDDFTTNHREQNDQSSSEAKSLFQFNDEESLQCHTIVIDQTFDRTCVEKLDFSCSPNIRNSHIPDQITNTSVNDNVETDRSIFNELDYTNDHDHDNVLSNECSNDNASRNLSNPSQFCIPSSCSNLHLSLKQPFDRRCGFGRSQDSLKLCS